MGYYRSLGNHSFVVDRDGTTHFSRMVSLQKGIFCIMQNKRKGLENPLDGITFALSFQCV